MTIFQGWDICWSQLADLTVHVGFFLIHLNPLVPIEVMVHVLVMKHDRLGLRYSNRTIFRILVIEGSGTKLSDVTILQGKNISWSQLSDFTIHFIF